MREARKLFPVLLAATALLLPATWAQEPQRTHDITVDDYLSVYLITTCRTAPGGQRVAFTELRWWDHDEARSTDLWVVEPATGRATRLTFERGNEDTPQWSPDGDRLYFVTKRNRGDKKPPYDGSRQVWVMGTQPGEPLPVTRVKSGIEGYQLSQDGRTLYYAKEGEEAEQGWKELRKKYADIQFGDGPVKFTEIWKLDLETWREEKVVSQERVVTEFKVSADQRRVAMITTPDGRLITKEGQSRVDIYDAQTKEITTLPDRLWRAEAPSPYGWLENLAWAPDSAALAFTVDFDGYPGELFCTEPRGDEWHVWRLKREGEIHHAGQLEFRPGTRDLCFLAQDHARQRVYCVRDLRDGRQGTTDLLTPGDIVVHGLSFAADGSGLAVIVSTPVHMPDVYWLDLRTPDAALARLTRINPQIDTWKLQQISVVSWKAPDGATVEGILELPPDYKPGDGPLPMVVELHGGPTDATLIAMRYWIYGRTIFAAKGYALLSPNYRGSTGYGDKFMTDLIGREADIEVQDVLAGVDAMVERGIADPERLGVAGWSNGGFVANAVITATTRFKAASTGAGVVDQFLQWGLEDTPGHVINYMRGLPWERADAYIKASPAYKLGNVTTPTIVHVGEKDDRVPAAHARALYRALKEYTKTPTVLLVYPGAGHGLAISDHRKGKLDWDVAWFERYLRGKVAEPPEEEK
jgi:dipeptidyl aminopeptidase/acylaminoacyl peptidase